MAGLPARGARGARPFTVGLRATTVAIVEHVMAIFPLERYRWSDTSLVALMHVAIPVGLSM